jgi:beta-lactamase superfamily II metal-dependent hydrolase
MDLGVIVFNVGRGLCVAIQTPSSRLVLIDCGNSDDFSPVSWLAERKNEYQARNGYALTKLFITHPHNDHIADIEKITNLLPPSIILRQADPDWTRVLSGSRPTQALNHYREHYCPPHYCEQILPDQLPDWGDGMTLTSYSISPETSARISSSDNSYVNNLSFVTILRYRGYTFAFMGDNESEGLDALLAARPALRNEVGLQRTGGGCTIGGVNFLIAPHHGHSSGFCTNWFQLTGPTKMLNVVCERTAGPHEDTSRVAIDSRYSSPMFSSAQNREQRRMVSTRSDGHIFITVDQNNQWDWRGIL